MLITCVKFSSKRRLVFEQQSNEKALFASRLART